METDDSKQPEKVIQGPVSTKIENILNDVNALETSIDDTAEKLKHLTSNLEKFLNIKKSDEAQQSTESDEKVSNKKEDTVHNGDECDVSNQQKQTEILDRDGLIDLLRSIQIDTNDRLCVGFVGYPNVGKSSTINCLMSAKKVFIYIFLFFRYYY